MKDFKKIFKFIIGILYLFFSGIIFLLIGSQVAAMVSLVILSSFEWGVVSDILMVINFIVTVTIVIYLYYKLIVKKVLASFHENKNS